MPEYLEVLDGAQAAVAMMACELTADALTEVVTYEGLTPEAIREMRTTIRTLKETIAATSQDQEMWIDASNLVPVCEAIWDVDMYKADCADDPYFTYVAEKVGELGLLDMALAYRPT